MKKLLGVLCGLLTTYTAHAGDLSVNFSGTWLVSGLPGVSVSATLDSSAIDLNPQNASIGEYRLSSLSTQLPQLGKMVLLEADISNSFAYLYPSPDATTFGELLLTGYFAAGANELTPGNYADHFEFRFYFSQLAHDTLATLETPLNLKYASGYVTNSIGAYSANFYDESFAITSSVDEPVTAMMMLAGLASISLAGRRAGRRASKEIS